MKLKKIMKQIGCILRYYWGILIAVVFFIFCLINLLTNYQRRELNSLLIERDEPVVEIEHKEENYVTETSYDGTKKLDPLVFAYPFKKSQFYISNKELVDILDKSKLDKLQQRAEDFILEYYQIDSRNLILEYGEKENRIKSFFPEETTILNAISESVDTKIYVDDYLKAIADAELQTAVTFTTDKCLVFEELSGYSIRGILEIKVFNYNDMIDLSQYYQWELMKGNTYKIIIDIVLAPDYSRAADTYKINQIDIIDVFIQE